MWEWVIPIAFGVIWIISHFLKDREPDAPARRPRADDRTPTSDIDKFLQEIDRLRKESRERSGQPETQTPPRPVVVKKPKPQPKQTGPRSRPVVRAISASEALPVVTVAIGDRPTPTAVIAVPGALTAVPRPVAAKPKSPALSAAVALLRSPQSLTTAFVLREVLDRPRCIRRRS